MKIKEKFLIFVFIPSSYFSSVFLEKEGEEENKPKKRRKEKKEEKRKRLVIPQLKCGITSHRKGFMVLIAVSRNYAASLGANVCKK